MKKLGLLFALILSLALVTACTITVPDPRTSAAVSPLAPSIDTLVVVDLSGVITPTATITAIATVAPAPSATPTPTLNPTQIFEAAVQAAVQETVVAMPTAACPAATPQVVFVIATPAPTVEVVCVQPTATPTPTASSTATATASPTNTPVPPNTPVPTPTRTPTATSTPTARPTNTPTATASPTNTPIPPTSTPVPPATPDPCPISGQAQLVAFMPQAIPDTEYPGYSIWDAEDIGLEQCVVVFTGQLTRPEHDVNSVVIFGSMKELLYTQGSFYFIRPEMIPALAEQLALESHTSTGNNAVLYDATLCGSMDRACWTVLAVHPDGFTPPAPVLPRKP